MILYLATTKMNYAKKIRKEIEMFMIGEILYFLGLQVILKEKYIFISQINM